MLVKMRQFGPHSNLQGVTFMAAINVELHFRAKSRVSSMGFWL